MLGGSVDLYDEVVSWYVAESGVPFLSVELRLAPEATSRTGRGYSRHLLPIGGFR